MKLMAINDQMEMAFSSPAPRVDPVSGNEVPPGSLPVEVRDDIDVKLSEGEYVVPADVLRFHGVKFFEDLRAEAKMGLAGMESAGRIGGQPVDSSPMDPASMGISEEDIAMLEQALAGEGLPEAAMAEGGLMDKVAFAAMNDPLVNERINSKGMAVGFAAGGMTQSLYNDPTKIDSLIDQVMTAAQTNPSLLEQLSNRGISINTTQADMQPTEMKQANTQPVELAHGGSVHKGPSSGQIPEVIQQTPLGFSGDMGTGVGKPSADTNFNPFQYGLGYSSFGPTTPVGYAPPPVVTAPTVAGSALSLGDPNAGQRGGVAIGQMMPNGKIRMPDSYYAGGGDADQKRALKKLGETDPNAWMGKYNFSDPDILRQQTLAALNKEQGIISSTIGNAPFGQVFQAAQGSEFLTIMETLRNSGTKEEDATMDDAFKKWKDSRLGAKPNKIISSILNNTRGDETAAALLEDNQNHWSAIKRSAAQDKLNKEIGEAETYSSTPQTVANQSGRTATDRANEQAQQAHAEKKLAKTNTEYAKKSGIKGAEEYTVGNKGGLMIKKK